MNGKLRANADFAIAQRKLSRKSVQKVIKSLSKCGKLAREIVATAKEYPEFEVDHSRYELIASNVKENLRILKKINNDLSRAERRGRRGRRRR